MQAVEAGTEMAVMPQEGSREGKYLTFVLGGEEYGLEILKVKEIIGVMNIDRGSSDAAVRERSLSISGER